MPRLLEELDLAHGDGRFAKLLGKLTGGKLQIDRWREKAAAQAQVKAEIIKCVIAST
nr:hypothetical protein [Pseudomonas toyotomiensis]